MGRVAMTDRPSTPESWLAKYDERLSAGRGLTAREWDHYGELERTVARRAPALSSKNGGPAS